MTPAAASTRKRRPQGRRTRATLGVAEVPARVLEGSPGRPVHTATPHPSPAAPKPPMPSVSSRSPRTCSEPLTPTATCAGSTRPGSGRPAGRPAELYERPYLEFMHPEDRGEGDARSPSGSSTCRAARAMQVEARARCAATARTAGFAAARPSPTGRSRSSTSPRKDVTDLREAVEQLAGERTRSVRRTAELERSNAELERFASVVSHDLRQSLTAVSGFLALLESPPRRRAGPTTPPSCSASRGRAPSACTRSSRTCSPTRASATPAAAPERVDAGELVRPDRADARPPGAARSRSASCPSSSRARASSSSCWPT